MLSNLLSTIKWTLSPLRSNHKHKFNSLCCFANCIFRSISSSYEISPEIKQFIADNRMFKDVSIDNYNELIHSQEDENKINNILNTYELIKYESGYAPSVIAVSDMKIMLNLENNNAIVKYIGRLYKRELLKLTSKAEKTFFKSERAHLISQMFKNSDPLIMGIEYDSKTGAPLYGKWRNTYFIGLSKTVYHSSVNPLLCYSALMGQKIVFDCDFFNIMTEDLIKLTNLHLTMSFGLNRKFQEPFDIWILNFKIVSHLQHKLIDHFKQSNQGVFINFREESYLDLFPHKKLKYLSPNAKNELEEFDHDAIYIIGAYNDHGKNKPLTFLKSQKEKIPSYRLPSEKYFSFKTTKVLNIYQVMKFLLLLKHTGDVYNSLKNTIPPSRYKSDEEIENEQLIRIKKLKEKKKLFRLPLDEY